MAIYSIKDIEQITGIKAHTLRIWEKRYSLVTPQRTSTNIRLYSDDDLRRLLNFALLKASGIKISKLAGMNELEIRVHILEATRQQEHKGNQTELLVLAMVNFNQVLFERILSRAILNSGMEEAVFNILFPFFEKVGVLWQTGIVNPAQEHFVSNIIRQKLFVALDSLPIKVTSNGLKIIFFLREGELHEISLLFYAYLAKKMGHHVLYLGQNVPIKDLISTVNSYKASALFTSFITPFSKNGIDLLMDELLSDFANLKIGITGLYAQKSSRCTLHPIQIISSPKNFKDWLNTK